MSQDLVDPPTSAAPKANEQPPGIEVVLGLEAATAPSGWRRVLLTVLGALVILALLIGYSWPRDTREAEAWVSQEVIRGDLVVTVVATGTVEPTNEVEISSELSGTIRTVYVDFNDSVTAGRVLAVLDTNKLEALAAVCSATLASKRARVLEATATVTEKEVALARVRRLAKGGAQSAQDLDAALAAHLRAVAAKASAEAECQVAEADLRLKATDLVKARITSPIRGVVLQRNVDPGQTVAASLQAPVLFTLAEDLSRMELQVDVDEADVGVTQVGQRATFTVDAYPDRTFPAVLRQLRFAPETTEGVVTYKAILSIDNTDLLLRPGMTATAQITVQKVSEALLVPNEALRFDLPSASEDQQRGFMDSLIPGRRRFHRASAQRPKTGVQRIWMLRDGRPTAVEVVPGPTDGDRTVILEGDLEEGEQVVVDVR